jgi:hypothetical protein
MHPIDILYTPLDVPVMPKIDILKLREWIKNSADGQILENRIDAKERADPAIYPWDAVYCKFNYSWYNNFNTLFPELSEYFDTVFKIPAEHINYILLLPIKADHIGGKFWHNDPDHNGLRLYIENDEPENFLYIKSTKYPYTGSPDSPDTLFKTWKFDDFQKQTYSAKLASPTQAYYLNNFRSVHCPNSSKLNSQRIAVALTFDKKYTAFPDLMKLITDSAEKFKDYSIFWTPEE